VTFVEKIRVRYNECDMQNVVFNANYWMYADDVVAQWIRHAMATGSDSGPVSFQSIGFDFMLKTATGTWHKGAVYGDVIEATCHASRWGNTSFDVAVAMTVDSQLIFDCSITYVSVTPGTHTPVAVPDHVRHALSA